jgi:hypothetical protein
MRSAFFGLVLAVTSCLFLMSACFSKGKGSSISYDGGLPDALLPGVNLPDAGTKRYSVGGTVDGLKGGGLVLQATGSGLGLSASEDVTVSPNGSAPVSFRFATAVPSGTHYAVVVMTQPSNPTQNCTVSAGTGVVPHADVVGIVVNCSTTSFIIGGNVTGAEGTGLSLNDNGGDTITVTNGAFAFPKAIPSGSTYAVTVVSSPTFPSETCTVTQGSGTVGKANVINVVVNCIPNVFNVGGRVVGLTGSGLVLTDNASDNLTVSGNGAFTFAVPVTSGSPYTVSIATQPSNPTQVCTLAGQTGTVGDGDVSSILVNCSANTFTVSGTVSNLAGSGLVLNTSAGSLSITSNGGFALPVALSNGASYSVAVAVPPMNPSQTCNVTGGTGVIAGANVTSIAVNCSTSDYNVGVQVSGLAAGSSLTFSDNGGDDLVVSANGTFTFATPLSSGAGYDVTIEPQASGPTCTFPSGSSGVIGSASVTIAVQCSVGDFCVNWLTDPNNCGGCGTVCPANMACQGGSCVCPSGGDAQCGCVNEQTDANNCGACGHRCSAGEACQTGGCVCTTGTMCCGDETCASGGTCVNEQADPRNCGACGRICPTGEICTTIPIDNVTTDVPAVGRTGCACPTGQNECRVVTDGPTTTYCADWSTDANNCGGCGNVCPTGHTCQDGNCCGAQTLCNGACVDETSDPNNCGGCGSNACSYPTPACVNSGCASGCAVATNVLCGEAPGTCTDTTSDPLNCGNCNVVCPNGSCAESTCCPLANNILCGNACVDESVDGNCGGCGVTCSQYELNCTNTSGPYSCCSGLFGKANQLEIACASPTGAGGCTDQSTDTFNCGSCGNDCTEDEDLVAPACCNSGCVDTSDDPNNCLGCGNVCPGDPNGIGSPVCVQPPVGSVELAVGGGCSLNCGGGTVLDCNRACTNTATDPNNCGQCGNPDSGAGVCAASTDPNAVAVCNGGECGFACNVGYTLCDDTGLCTLTSSDVNNCGACDNVCPGDPNGVAQCNGGCSVACNDGFSTCNGVCTSTNSTANCGGTCDPTECQGTQTCPEGVCVCPGAQTLCNGVCVDETSDPNNCGRCTEPSPAPSYVCPEGLTCQNSSCCAGGQRLCPPNDPNGRCVDVTTDPNNCGGCGSMCPAGVTCSGGNCCGAGEQLCSSVCVNEQTDPNNCGGCSIVCPPGGNCQSGTCCGSSQILCGPSSGPPASVDVTNAGQ